MMEVTGRPATVIPTPHHRHTRAPFSVIPALRRGYLAGRGSQASSSPPPLPSLPPAPFPPSPPPLFTSFPPPKRESAASVLRRSCHRRPRGRGRRRRLGAWVPHTSRYPRRSAGMTEVEGGNLAASPPTLFAPASSVAPNLIWGPSPTPFAAPGGRAAADPRSQDRSVRRPIPRHTRAPPPSYPRPAAGISPRAAAKPRAARRPIPRRARPLFPAIPTAPHHRHTRAPSRVSRRVRHPSPLPLPPPLHRHPRRPFPRHTRGGARV